MTDQFVYQFLRNETESVCISIREYKQRRYIDLRVFYQPEDGTDLRPTKKGITIGLQLLPELKKGIIALEQQLRAGTNRGGDSPLQKGAKSV